LKHKGKEENNKKNVNIRMVSGDHIGTATKVAYESGILDKEDTNIDFNATVMTGE
jgi:magnesium-transporting ATPase (P-type)